MATFIDRLQHAWNAFRNKDPTGYLPPSFGMVSTFRPDKQRLRVSNERSIVNAIYNRIAIDCAAIAIRHVKTDENERYIEEVESGLNNCLKIEANIDQTGRSFIQDAVMSMLDEGIIAIVPVDTDIDPNTGSYDIKTLRVGKIVQWWPEYVRVLLYNDRTGQKEEITLPKKIVGIVENPLYSVMNEPNSTMQRLMRKLNLLDLVDEQSSSGKLDLIIQLPYVVKSKLRKEEAEKRRQEIADQLNGSKYGIAYADGTEKIIQLNRPIENNLMSQIEYLTKMLYSQLGITEEVFNGTADEAGMLNYNNRTIEPIVSSLVDEMKRKFLTKTARTKHHTVMAFKDPFKLIPVANIADIADKFTRNAILSSNEIRGIIGFKPSADPEADELSNKNISKSAEEIQNEKGAGPGMSGLTDEAAQEGV